MTTYEDTTDGRVDTTFEQDGWTLTVFTQQDHDSSPRDADCYTAEQVAAFDRDDWYFVGVIVKASRHGIVLGEASLWGIESGYFTYTDEDDNVTGHGRVGPYTEAVDDLIVEAVDDAKANLASLCAGAS